MKDLELLRRAMHALRDLSAGYPSDELEMPLDQMIGLIAQHLNAVGQLSIDDIVVLGDRAEGMRPLDAMDAKKALMDHALQQALEDGVTYAAFVQAMGENAEKNAYAQAAIEQYVFGSDGDIEIDDVVMISPSEDGAYVSAWLWVDQASMKRAQRDMAAQEDQTHA